MIIDTSVLLAIFFNESSANWATQQLSSATGDLYMSTVNLSETLIRILDKQPKEYQAIRDELLESTIRFIAPDVKQSEIAALARMKYPLNLGDCFAYALAKEKQMPLITLDSDFKQTDLKIIYFGK